jgi:two-component system, chemotaxis family, chemotaxis protein CheY
MAKILIVDDSETLRTQLRKTLEEASHEVLEGYDGVNGLETLRANPDVQLILCDVNMPEMDGITMCSKVHEDDGLNKIPIFMLTTESNPEMKAKGKEVGVKAWVTKPFVATKLLAAIEKITSR